MTEQEWDTGTDAVPMLDFLRVGAAASNRKTRLWACACCRRLLHLFPDDGHRRHVARGPGVTGTPPRDPCGLRQPAIPRCVRAR